MLDELLSILQSGAKQYSKMFIVVDALDERSEADGTRRGLLAALRTLKNVLVTSHDLSSIATDF